MLLFEDSLRQAFLSLLIIRLIGADFTTPPDYSSPDLNYTFGSIIPITWQTDLKRITLSIFSNKDQSWNDLRKSP